jgi:hypothetical protein
MVRAANTPRLERANAFEKAGLGWTLKTEEAGRWITATR